MSVPLLESGAVKLCAAVSQIFAIAVFAAARSLAPKNEQCTASDSLLDETRGYNRPCVRRIVSSLWNFTTLLQIRYKNTQAGMLMGS